MKIFYAVQATGNGHISRAMTLLPYLEEFGQVDIFLSGDNSHLPLTGPVRYRSSGISLYYDKKGGLSYLKTTKKLRLFTVLNNIRNLPVEKYDIVINDFDVITAMACGRKRVPFIHFGHQASFRSEEVPRPEQRQFHGEWLLKNYVRSNYTTGLHFEKYAPFIFEPIIKKEILESVPADKEHITVYLPAYQLSYLLGIFSDFPHTKFQLFSPEANQITLFNNITIFPVSKASFDQSFIHCHGIICGAGFETPAEALQMGKKLLVIPIQGQYEQQCNAAALKKMGIPVIGKLHEQQTPFIKDWIESSQYPLKKDYSKSIAASLQHVFGHLNHMPSGIPAYNFPIAK